MYISACCMCAVFFFVLVYRTRSCTHDCRSFFSVSVVYASLWMQANLRVNTCQMKKKRKKTHHWNWNTMSLTTLIKILLSKRLIQFYGKDWSWATEKYIAFAILSFRCAIFEVSFVQYARFGCWLYSSKLKARFCLYIYRSTLTRPALIVVCLSFWGR